MEHFYLENEFNLYKFVFPNLKAVLFISYNNLLLFKPVALGWCYGLSWWRKKRQLIADWLTTTKSFNFQSSLFIAVSKQPLEQPQVSAKFLFSKIPQTKYWMLKKKSKYLDFQQHMKTEGVSWDKPKDFSALFFCFSCLLVIDCNTINTPGLCVHGLLALTVN